MGIVIRLLLRTANRTAPKAGPLSVIFEDPLYLGAVRAAYRTVQIYNVYLYTVPNFGSWSNTKMRTVKINGSVRFALLTVRLKNGTVTVAVKNGTVKKTENGTVR